MEHTTFDLHDVQAMVMAAERGGVTPIVRTPGFDPAFILRLLDMGVQGGQVPHVSSAAVALEVVKAVCYPPEGERGMAAGSRAANFAIDRVRRCFNHADRAAPVFRPTTTSRSPPTGLTQIPLQAGKFFSRRAYDPFLYSKIQ